MYQIYSNIAPFGRTAALHTLGNHRTHVHTIMGSKQYQIMSFAPISYQIHIIVSTTAFRSRETHTWRHTWTKPHVHNSVVRCMRNRMTITLAIEAYAVRSCVIWGGFTVANLNSRRAHVYQSQLVFLPDERSSSFVRYSSDDARIRHRMESWIVKSCDVWGGFTVVNFRLRRAYVYRSQCVCQQDGVTSTRDTLQRA